MTGPVTTRSDKKLSEEIRLIRERLQDNVATLRVLLRIERKKRGRRV